ncbi:MAG TPA: hypothetical protein VMZ06_00690 [Candidatus Bathyarchaeia archaeon]|nr:hypothetical protein [Candidatus Bathyarchaeia archaeon]
MSKGNRLDFDAAGWVFWSVVSLALMGPAVWLAWKIVDPYVSRIYPIGIGAIGAIIGASFVSTGVNYLIQLRRKKVRLTERKKSKKHK